MAVGGVQAQEAVASWTIAGVHHRPEQLAQVFCLQWGMTAFSLQWE